MSIRNFHENAIPLLKTVSQINSLTNYLLCMVLFMHLEQSNLNILRVLRMLQKINESKISFKKDYETKSGTNEERLDVYQVNQLEILDKKQILDI